MSAYKCRRKKRKEVGKKKDHEGTQAVTQMISTFSTDTCPAPSPLSFFFFCSDGHDCYDLQKDERNGRFFRLSCAHFYGENEPLNLKRKEKRSAGQRSKGLLWWCSFVSFFHPFLEKRVRENKTTTTKKKARDEFVKNTDTNRGEFFQNSLYDCSSLSLDTCAASATA